MRTRTLRSLLPAAMCALLIGAQACREVPTAGLPENVEVRLLNPAAWPGSDLIIVSSALTGATALPEVMLDTFRLAVARVGDSTVTARLPDSSGTFAIHVRLQGGDRYGSVRIVGFVRHTDAIPLTGWPLSAWPGSPIMMVATESSLVKLDLRSGMATSHWNIPHWGGCSVSPGPSFRQGGVVAQGRSRTAPNSCERALTWLGAVPVDSAPFVAGNRLWAELSPDTWLFAAHHDMWIYRSGQLVASEKMESTERLVFSPDRLLAVPLTLEALAGVPVIATSTGTIASRLPVVQNWATVFSPDGDTIFVAGRRGFGPGDAQQLMAVSTSSGAVAAQMADSVPFLEDLVLDPEGPWLYAVESNGPTIHIYDRSSLRHLLSFQPPAASSCGPYCGLQVGLAIDPSTRRLYVLGIKSWGEDFYRGPSDIFTFELLPTIQVPQILTP